MAQNGSKYKIKIKIQGIPSLSTFLFKSKIISIQNLYYTGDVEKGFLATDKIYISIAHNKKL